MSRVKGGVTALKRRRKVLSQTKGFRWQRSKKERAAKEALLHAGRHAFQDRRKKKGNFRALWNIKINAASRENGISYSKLIDKLNKANVRLNRKVLSELAEKHPEVFKQVLEIV
ncbi:MAG: 50S ribosomal protein L20 [Candidatus Giovannonibacteria bacterium GW2011_GWA2_44_13b]|uniref:Large ribosomal subunit protein bL20 n=1 Tax=Candidatus Giovannonibacteria bacterium GW2011_GWA2_44_13b TaxID=1618647 RepID=A0A0G1J9L5_9BACT|nr:MAG: 50S ribosomal protein L20 [Candidatus Giovannonibacteria bacterium GW2011_GWA2_44_13b]